MNFKKKVLDNGLTVLFEKRDVPVTTVMLATKYGAAYENEQEKGLAHFLEHMVFKGTKTRSAKKISEEIERLGGDLNAFTHEETTAFHAKIPSEHLKIAMEVLFDVFFFPIFPEDEIKKESSVVVEEIKMYRDNPRSHVIEQIKNNLYEKPFGEFIGGSEKNVLGFTRDDLKNKHDEVYVSGNSILCVVGNNEMDEVLEIISNLKICEGKANLKIPEIVLKNEKSSETREGISQTNLVLGFHFPFSGDKQKYAAEVFSAILGEGMSSKLFSEVREKRGLVYSVKTNLDMGKNYGYMIIWAGTDKGKEKEVKRVCLEEFSKMKDVSEDEVAAAKIQVIGNRKIESEGSDGVAVDLIMEELSGDAKDYYEYEKNINSVTLEDIKELADFVDYSYFSLGP